MAGTKRAGLLPIPEDDPYYYLMMRDRMAPNDPFQSIAGPLEHRAFARQAVGDNPLAALSLAAMVPGYTAGKAAGLIKTRSPASMDEIWAGYQGIGQGLADFGQGLFSGLTKRLSNGNK